MAKRSKTYNRLKPFIVETIANTRSRGSVSAGGTGGGGTGVTDHGALTGLSDDDHTQYLLASGGRTLTGNMAVTAGVTIDGVDISGHAADPDAHHNRVTVSDPLAISTQAISLTLGNGVETSAAALRVKRPTNSGLALDSTGLYLAPSTLTVSTSNGVSGSGHTHGITASSDVGTTPAEALLKSTAGGALTLASLTAKGNVDITTGGDLTVGSNILFVDASQSNVGINCSPDPQFDLDVNGNLRATYIIGKHAIQLKGVLLLSHFDGRAPYETNYSGEPTGHMGQVASPTGGVIFRPGKFYKALQVAAAATNVISNPSFETNTTSWNAILSASIARTNEGAVIGSYCAGVTTAGSNSGGVTFAYTTSTGGAWTASIYLKAYTAADVGDNVSVRIRFNYTDVTSADTAVNHALAADWTRVSVSATANGAKTVSSIEVHVRDLLSQSAHQWLMDAVQLEVGAIASPYCDGTLGGYTAGGVPDGSAHAWSGTAHASTSSRTAGSLTYPVAGNLLPNVGTVMAWVNPSYLHPTDIQTVFRATGTSAGHIMLRLNSIGKPEAYWGTGAVTTASAITAGAWTHLAMTYDGTTLSLYVNGVLSTSGAASGFSGMPTTQYVGVYSGAEWFGGLIDDLAILERACVADEIRSIYESDAPVFAETARFSFRATPKGLVWADDEGLWMRDATGGPVLGAYGGEAATKSWASLTLAAGDVVLGDGASSYLLWDDSAGTLKLNTVSGADTAYMLLSGFYLDMYDASVRRFRFDGDLGQVTIGQVASGKANVYITDNYVSLSVYTTDKVVLSATGGDSNAGYIQVGQSGASRSYVHLDTAGIFLRTTDALNVVTTNMSLSTAGVITVGEVASGKSNVQISAGVISLRNNTTSVITLRATAAADGTIASFDQPIGLGSGGGIYQGTGTFTTPNTGLKFSYDGTATQIGVYNGTVLNASYGGGDMRFLITSSSTSTYNQLQFVKVISTASIDSDYHSKLFGVYDSGNKRNTLYMRSYANTSTDAAYQSRIRLEAFAYNGSTQSGPVFELYKDNSGSYAYIQTDNFYIDGYMQMPNEASHFSAPSDGYCKMYVKLDKLIFSYTAGATTRYLSIPLNDLGTTWAHSTTAP